MWPFSKKKKKEKSKEVETKNVSAEEETKSAEKDLKEEKTEVSKSNVSKETVTENTKSKKALYRVLYDKEEKVWTIKKDGAKRIIAKLATKEEALNRVKELSTNNEVNYVVYKKDGKFQKK